MQAKSLFKLFAVGLLSGAMLTGSPVLAADEAPATESHAEAHAEKTEEKPTTNHLVLKIETENWKKATKAFNSALAQKDGIVKFEPVESLSILRVSFKSDAFTPEDLVTLINESAEGAYTTSVPRMFLTQVKVDGMTCQGCVNAATKELNKVEGVALAIVELESGIAQVLTLSEEFDVSKANAAIEKAGYKVGKLPEPPAAPAEGATEEAKPAEDEKAAEEAPEAEEKAGE